ncbi:MAG: calcium-binding protein, partial [Actinomycetota bacterium]
MKRIAAVATMSCALVAALLALQPATFAQKPRVKCGSKAATIVGTPRADELVGTSGPDVIVGLGGDDQIRARGGRDLVCGGEGFDNVTGGADHDRLKGGAGDDFLGGGPGRDRLEGEKGVDVLFGGPGNDLLLAGSNNAPFPVEALVGGPGDDHLDGGRGLDSAQFFDASQGIVADLTTDTATGEGSDELLRIEGVVGSNFDDVIVGDDTTNGLFGQEGDDQLLGLGSGDLASGKWDLLSGDDGADDILGGDGFDMVTYDRIPVPVTVDLAAGVATGQGEDTLQSTEGAWGSRLDDVLIGNPSDNAFIGGFGNDDMDGGSGTDTAIFRSDPGPVVADLSSDSASGTGLDVLTGFENLWGSGGSD